MIETTPSSNPSTTPPTRRAVQWAKLEVVAGDATPRSVPIAGVPVRMGRSAGNDLMLTDPAVSRVHAEIRYESGGYIIQDLASANGTCVDGVFATTARLRSGASIKMGACVLEFSQPDPEVTDHDRMVLLEKSDLLRVLELPTLAAAAKLLSLRFVPKGGVLVRQMTPMDGMFFVERGSLRVVEINDEGGERVVARVEAGSHFGERALVTAISAPHTLVADDDSCVLELTKAAFDGLTEAKPLAEKVRSGLHTVWHHVPTVGVRRDGIDDIVTPTDVEIIGEDNRILRAKERLGKLAKDPQPILIVGAPGSGKRMFARYFHHVGPRRSEPYVEVSVAEPGTYGPGAAIFGLESGPADSTKGQTGYLEMIGEGTLTIAHAELLEPHLQTMLAEYIKLGWFHRIHGRGSVQSQTRVILVATGDEAETLAKLSPALRELVAKRTVVSPALTQRLKDIPLLAEHYLRIHSERTGRVAAPLSREATERLLSYAWPGNVRELENVMQRASILASAGSVTSADVIIVPPAEKETHKLNLLKDDRIRDFLRQPWLMRSLIWIDIIFVAMVTAVTLYGGIVPAGAPLSDKATNPGMLVTWLIWFPVLPLSAFLVGRLWCGVCPIAGFGDLAGRVMRFNLPVPKILKRLDFWLLAATFILVDYVEELFGVADQPWATAMFLVVILSVAAIMTVIYERKTFCRYVCPLAGVLGAYSAMSILEIRGNKKVCQSQCGEHSCHKGTAEVAGCPLSAYPASINTNAECMMCLNCVRSCENRGVQLNLRPPLQELWRNAAPMLSMSIFSVIMVGLMAKHQFPKLAWWGQTVQQLGWSTTEAHTILFVGFALVALTLFLVSSMLSAAASRETMTANATAYGIAFLPLAFSGHMAHLAHEFLGGGIDLLINYVSSAFAPASPVVSPQVVTFIAFLVVFAGFVGSMVALVMIARRRSNENVFARMLPHMLVLMLLWIGYLTVFTGTMG